jgi:hypothetical protein
MTDDDARAFFAWADRERAITRLMYAGKLGFGELALRRQMSYDRLLAETPSEPQTQRDHSANQ